MRRGDLEHHDAAARTDDADHLAKAAVQVREVPRPEADRRGVEFIVAERERQRVGDFEPDRQAVRFRPRQLQHPLREINGHHLAILPDPLRQGDRQIAGARGHVKRPVARAERGQVGGSAPPLMVQAGGHDRVHPVVQPSDAIEHRPHLGLLERPGHRGAAITAVLRGRRPGC